MRHRADDFLDRLFVDLEYQTATEDRTTLDGRLGDICAAWPIIRMPYDFVKLAHFLEMDHSPIAQELLAAALRTAWRLRLESDDWDDSLWREAVDCLADESDRKDILAWAGRP